MKTVFLVARVEVPDGQDADQEYRLIRTLIDEACWSNRWDCRAELIAELESETMPLPQRVRRQNCPGAGFNIPWMLRLFVAAAFVAVGCTAATPAPAMSSDRCDDGRIEACSGNWDLYDSRGVYCAEVERLARALDDIHDTIPFDECHQTADCCPELKALSIAQEDIHGLSVMLDAVKCEPSKVDPDPLRRRP